MTAPVPADVLSRLKAVLGPRGWSQDAERLAPKLVEWRDRWSGTTPLLLLPRTTAEVAALGTNQVAVLSSAQVNALTIAESAALTSSEAPAFSDQNIADVLAYLRTLGEAKGQKAMAQNATSGTPAGGKP